MAGKTVFFCKSGEEDQLNTPVFLAVVEGLICNILPLPAGTVVYFLQVSASYINVQKLQIQPTVTSIVLGFTGSGGGSLGTVTVRTPSSQAALIASRSASAGSVYLRMKVPALRSMRMYFTPGTCSSRLRTPLIASTLWLSNSTCINQPRHQIHTLPARLRILIFVSVELRIFQNEFLLKLWLLKVVNAFPVEL